jgi:hypothetical protein
MNVGRAAATHAGMDDGSIANRSQPISDVTMLAAATQMQAHADNIAKGL